MYIVYIYIYCRHTQTQHGTCAVKPRKHVACAQYKQSVTCFFTNLKCPFVLGALQSQRDSPWLPHWCHHAAREEGMCDYFELLWKMSLVSPRAVVAVDMTPFKDGI